MAGPGDSESGSPEKTKISAEEYLRKLKRENTLLKHRLKRLELVFRNSVDIILVIDAEDYTIRKASDAAEKILGYKHDDLVGCELDKILPNEDHFLSNDEGEVPEVLDGVFLDRKLVCSDGSIRYFDMTASLVESSGMSTLLLTFRDTTERKRFQGEILKKNSAMDSALSSMIVADSSWRITYANMEALRKWRYGRSEMLQIEIPDLFAFIGDFDNISSCIRENGHWEGEVECQRRDSTTFVALANAVNVDVEEDMDPCFVLSFLDITKRVTLEKRLTELSLHDNLTGLYNRRGFMTLGRQILESSRRKQPEIGLLYVDVDYLKLINDELGHSAGDLALETTARILRSCFRDSDIIARLGGDEFVVLFLDTTGLTVKSIRQRIEYQQEETVSARPLPFMLSLSIGYHSTVLCYKTQIGMLLSCADSLMYQDKEERRSSISEDDILKKI